MRSLTSLHLVHNCKYHELMPSISEPDKSLYGILRLDVSVIKTMDLVKSVLHWDRAGIGVNNCKIFGGNLRPLVI